MKYTSIIIAIICIISIANFSQAQTQSTNIWRGGTPGKTANWDCPKNWSKGSVPDAFQDVIIPDVSTGSGIYPVIETGSQEANSIVMEAGAKLEIREAGSLTVFSSLEGYGNYELVLKGR
ncbi:MAG: hypothetical protein MUC59_12530 [Saprospiraceae bacterium]|nr:hypothetical protein [Saprospiraceae bacterium]